MEAAKIDILDINQLEENKVQTFIEENILEETYTSILCWGSLKKVFGAEISGELVGLILSWKSSFHPYCIYFKLVLKEAPEQDTVALSLLKKLAEGNELPLQTSIWETDRYFMHFYEKQGLQLIRKTYMPVVPLDSLSIKREALSKCKCLTLSEVASNQALKHKLVTLTKQTYKETHKANPVANFEDETWEELIFADDTLLDLSFCVFDDHQQVLAFSYLHEETEGKIELGWVGFSGNNEEILLNLVSQQIEQAAYIGYQYITGEFDSTSPYAMLIYRNFRFPETSSWNTYQLKNR